MRLKNEVTVGMVVLASFVLLAFGALWLSGKPWGEEQRELVAVFTQVGELREGNPVKLRGVQVGRILEIELAPGGSGVYVTMQVPPDVALPPEPAVLLSPASLFGDWQASLISMPTQPNLVFVSVGEEGVLPGATLPDITELTAVGARIAGDLETLSDRVELAFTEETALEIRETIENVQDMSEQLSGFVADQTQTFDQIAQNALASSQNIEQTTAQVQQVAVQFGQSIDQGEIESIVTNVRVASENLRTLTAGLDTVTAAVPGFMAQLETTLASVSQIVTQLEPATAQLGPTIVEARTALATLQRAALRLEQGEGTLGRLLEDPALYEQMQQSLGTLQRLMADLQANPGRYIGEVKLF